MREPDRYFLKLEGLPEFEVPKDQYVMHERNAGFWNTRGEPDEPATAGFSSSRYPYRGRIQYGKSIVLTEGQVIGGEVG